MARTNTSPIDLTPDPEAAEWVVTRADVPHSMAQWLAAMNPDDESGGRSQWQAFRLPNGDLIVGFFPQGEEAYFEVADETGV